MVEQWLGALERRHLSDLTMSETARALRALSSCYVERRSRLASTGALATRGKRAAFALFYGPLHFLIVQHVIRSLPDEARTVSHVYDLGCGTGVAGAAWAMEAGARRIEGTDRHPWAVAEANWTYRQLRLPGRAVQGDLSRVALHAVSSTGILAAYAANELPVPTREALLSRLLVAHDRGARILILEPIARRAAPWWNQWARVTKARGGRSDEWRFAAALPPIQRQLARAAGLDPRELTARSLWW
jgi:hypothetical protein